MDNPWTYTKNPQTTREAQHNLNHFHFIEMGGVPDGINPANWNTYIREMKRDCKRQLTNLQRT